MQNKRLDLLLVRFQKVRGNLLDITAQDLLGKSHEELVLMLIHLRRQGAALKEAIDSTKAEMQSVAHHPNDTDENQKLHQDLICHIRELEDQHARAHPVITLVDNMVKLGSLYRGPADAPLSHRIRNLPTSSSSSSGVSSSYDSKSQRKTPFDDDKVKMAEQEKAVVQVRKYHILLLLDICSSLIINDLLRSFHLDDAAKAPGAISD